MPRANFKATPRPPTIGPIRPAPISFAMSEAGGVSKALLGLHGGVAAGRLDKLCRARINLALARIHGCEQALTAHTHMGRAAGLTGDEISANLSGSSHEARAAIAVGLACTLASSSRLTPTLLAAARGAGFEDSDIFDIITLVCLNSLENMVANMAACTKQ